MEDYKYIKDYDYTLKAIRQVLKNYVTEYKIKSLVLGVSGGIDSALVAAICAPVCKELGVNLIGRSITIQTNTLEERKRAATIGSFCNDFKEVDLTSTFIDLREVDELDDQVDYDDGYKIRIGNIKARLRMIYLYNLAQKEKGLVMSTDNYTEFLLGFWTLHGDVGDLGLIQNLWKTEVYGMSQWIADNEMYHYNGTEGLKACIKANATDGLGISGTDLDQIMPDWKDRHANTMEGYSEVDDVLKEYFNTREVPTNGFEIIGRMNRTAFKRNNPTNINRNILI